jgi:hypothetical protein
MVKADEAWEASKKKLEKKGDLLKPKAAVRKNSLN